MDRQGIYNQLKGHRWILRRQGTQVIKMGETGGLLNYSFSETGELFSEAHFDFDPGLHYWTFDEAQQFVELRDADKKIVQRLTVPEQIADQLVMRDPNGTDVFSCYAAIDAILNLQIAPQPLFVRAAVVTPIVQSGQVIIQIGMGTTSPLQQSASDLGIHVVPAVLRKRSDWSQLVQLILAHPQWQQIALLGAHHRVLRNPFLEMQAHLLYVGDTTEWIALNEQRKVQKLDPTVLLGSRSIVLEFLTLLLIRKTISTEGINRVLYENMGARLVHGRQVTTLGQYQTAKTWIN
ncbi:hypothetical protein IV38_GL001912 [Lactobacillus selangorensis]|uniref:Uncharacterized protein n=1 Tax=Lactobacillus selangorensis TaxID=81857 RepID=A0A0R2FGH1_9LACO|nr:hypothetical protein [Lactobacillus selangorensis]KRN27699.1 hypothetical protein IV38_GL001912 [Lactobacillus selangorensis]KRN30336.1 hypothetical protein IV40_GL001925 [Lactobacillus selangorensis]